MESLLEDLSSLRAIIAAVPGPTRRLPMRNGDSAWTSFARRSHDAALPWERGYRAAQALRDILAVREQTFPSTASLLAAMAVLFPGLALAVDAGGRHRNAFLDAIAVMEPAPRLILLQSGERAQRFAICRAIYRSAQPGGAVRLITQAESAMQAAGRAFAAEFLVPADMLRARVRPGPSGEVDAEAVEDLADAFGVSQLVVLHQLHNHEIARVRDPVSGSTGWAPRAFA